LRIAKIGKEGIERLGVLRSRWKVVRKHSDPQCLSHSHSLRDECLVVVILRRNCVVEAEPVFV
jgi:hypothetical protein